MFAKAFPSCWITAFDSLIDYRADLRSLQSSIHVLQSLHAFGPKHCGVLPLLFIQATLDVYIFLTLPKQHSESLCGDGVEVRLRLPSSGGGLFLVAILSLSALGL